MAVKSRTGRQSTTPTVKVMTSETIRTREASRLLRTDGTQLPQAMPLVAAAVGSTLLARARVASSDAPDDEGLRKIVESRMCIRLER